MSSCIVCGNTQRIEKDHEVVCKCGTIYGVVDNVESIITRTKITSFNQNKLGSKNLVDPKLQLKHIDKKKTAIILEKNNKYDAEFLHCCDILNLHSSVTDTAFYMFQKLRLHKLGIGKTAVFCIYRACTTFEMVCDVDKTIKTIRWRFGLKRMFDLNDVIYSIKSVALELNLVPRDVPMSDSFAIKKYVKPHHHVSASKILGCFSGNAQKKAKGVEAYLRCYS